MFTHAVAQLFLTGRLSKIRRWTAHIMNISLKIFLLRNQFRLFYNGFMTAHLHSTSLMKCKRTEIASAKTPSIAN